MKQQTQSSADVEEIATTIVNGDGDFVDMNDEACELFGYEKGELLGEQCIELLMPNPTFKDAMDFAKMKDGRYQTQFEIERKDGTLVEVEANGKEMDCPERDGQCVKSNLKIIEEKGKKESNDTDHCDGICNDRLRELGDNIRVDTSAGTFSIREIILDIVEGHNDISRYKAGALDYHKSLDERLQEEEARSPDSDACKLLRGAKRSAYSLYLRSKDGEEAATDESNFIDQ